MQSKGKNKKRGSKGSRSGSSSGQSNSGGGGFEGCQNFAEFEEKLKQAAPPDGRPWTHEEILYEILNHPDNKLGKQTGRKPTMEEIKEQTRYHGRPFPREEMLRQHRQQREFMVQQMGKAGIGMLSMELRNPYYPIKPDTDSMDSKNCTRIYIRDLIMSTTHKNKVLRGRIIEPPILMTGLHSIIEDYHKDIIQVSVYNTGYNFMEAEKLFKVGNELSVYEPFYKSFSHGGAGIRVEKPQEVYVGPARSDLDQVDHRKEGNTFYKNKHFDKAIQCYTNGLRELSEVSKLLGNISVCLMKTEQQVPAMAYSCASVRIDNEYTKGWQRLLHTLQSSDSEGEIINTKHMIPKKLQSQINIEIPQIDIPKPAMWTFISGNIHELLVDESQLPKTELKQGDDFSVLKLQGNELFKQQKYTDAIFSYIHALKCHRDETALLLSNRAMSELQLGQFKEATYDATASLIVKHADNEKAAYRRLQGLRNMGKVKTALKVISGDNLYGNQQMFQALKEELKLMKKSSENDTENARKSSQTKDKTNSKISSKNSLENTSEKPSQKDTDISEKKHENNLENQQQGGNSSVESGGKGKNRSKTKSHRSSGKQNPTREDIVQKSLQKQSTSGDQILDMMRMMEMLEPEKVQKLKEDMFDTRVPEFYDEYIHAGHLPAQCNFELCRQWVSNAQQESKFATKRLTLMKPEYDENGPEMYLKTNALDIHRRLGPMSEERMAWFLTAPIGDNSPIPKENEYPKDMAQNFSTSWQKTVDVTYGTTHVMVGYLDLGHLLFATYRGDPSQGPVRIFGYEQSPYCTAKTHVIVNMMQKNSPPQNIFQVWFSSGWSKATLKNFRASVSDLLKTQNFHNDVRTIFVSWLKAPNVSLLQAQKTWLKYHQHHNNTPANFLKKQDRIDVISYMLTGRLLECDVGSVVMFSNPPFVPHMCHNEYVTDQLREYELVELYNKYGSFMEAVIHRLLDPLLDLTKKIHNQHIKINLRYQIVKINDKTIHSEIRSLEPYTIHWSNLVDYYNLHDFHKMVRACSAQEDTVHYMYSMNWVRDIKGASCLDYDLDIQIGIVKQSNLGLQEFYKISGVDKFMVSPPINHPWNEGDSAFCMQFHKKWTDEFFRIGRIKKKQVPLVLCEPYSLFSCSKGNIFFCYTYDESVNFLPS